MSNIKYIAWNDYTISISNTNLKEIVEQGVELTDLTEEELMNNAELTAIAEVKAYLGPLYDMVSEFALNFDDDPDMRNKLVIKCVVCISLYHLHMVISPRDVPEKIEKAYEHCLDMMEGARKGDIDMGLYPRPEDEGGQVSQRQLGSNVKFVSKPFTNAAIFDPQEPA